MPRSPIDFAFTQTGIGSVPFLDVEDVCRHIAAQFPRMPFWPQFVHRSYLEDMTIQFSEGLPLLEVREQERDLVVQPGTQTEAELVRFYDRALAEDIDYFAISEAYAPGLYTLLRVLSEEDTPANAFVKGEITGPVTFAWSIKDATGRPVLYNPEIREAWVQGLACKALWQVRRLGETGRRPVIFLDEPSLSGFGSAFSPIQREEVVEMLGTIIRYLKDRAEVLIGIHCCGNTDWPMIAQAGPDIISFDAFEYLDTFLLYPEALTRFIQEGGAVAWGIVPTSPMSETASLTGLLDILDRGLNTLQSWGLETDLLSRRSLLTPACGMGTLSPDAASNAMDLLARVSERLGR